MNSVLIIANPKAGRGKPLKKLPLVQNHLKSIGFESTVYLTQNTADYEGIREAINANENSACLLIIGGDGTLNDVINAIPEDCKWPLIVLPCGTGNDFATFIYGHKTIPEILDGLLQINTKQIDIAECNGQKFINGLGIGFDGWVAKKAAKYSNLLPLFLKYNLAILQGIFTYKAFYTNLGQSLIIAVANCPTYGGGFKIAPNADPSDGELDVWHIKPIPIHKRIYFLNLIKKGLHAGLEGPYSHQNIREITIQCHKNLPAHLDGEYFEADRFVVKLLNLTVSFVY